MNKLNKIISTIVIIFIFGTFQNVYADNECYYMPGKGNTVIIPGGYEAKCYYKFNKGVEIENRTTQNGVTVYFSKNGYQINYIEELETDVPVIKGSFANKNASFNGNNTLDGFGPIENSGYEGLIDAAQFDENINGCPKYFYWVKNDNNSAIGFSTESPTISTKGSYAIYTSDNTIDEYDGGLAIVKGKKEVITWYKTVQKKDYDKLISNCGDNITKIENPGFGQIKVDPNNTTEVLKTCNYYFEFDIANQCNITPIKFNYIKTTNNSKISLSVESDFPGLSLDNINGKINLVKFDNPKTYSNLSDYLIYNNGEWHCSDKIYIRKELDVPKTVFGVSKYEDFKNMFGSNEIAESHNSNTELCVTDNNNNNSNINFGDPVEVNCEGILGQELIDFLNKIFRWIQILAPIFVIIISGIDFAGAVLQDDKDALKKAANKFIKRLIIAVALFFIPLILSWLLNIFNDITGAASSTCGIGE